MTQHSVGFRNRPNDPYGPHTTVTPPNSDGGLANTPFLRGGVPTAPQGPNAESTLVYATTWIQRLSHPTRPPLMQIQYAQMCVLNFKILLMQDQGVIGWPHISVATLRESFA